MANYCVECGCGRRLTVTASQAGSTVDCQCGSAVAVPRLSELRVSAGEQAFETGVMDVIQRKIRDDELPSTDRCVVSGQRTGDVLWVKVVCEQTWEKKRTIRDAPSPWRVIATMLMPFGFLLRLFQNDGERITTIMGRDRSIRVPLRVATEHQGRLMGRLGRGRLRTAMEQQETDYASLLKEFPKAKLVVG